MAGAVPLGLASAALAERVRVLTAQALRTWSLRWGVEAEATCAPTLDAAAHARAGVEMLREEGDAPAACLLWPRALEAALQGALHGEEGDSASRETLAARSARHVAEDLRSLLAQAWQVRGWTPAADAAPVARWAAPVEVGVIAAGVRLAAIVPALRLRAAPARAVPPALLSAARLRAACAPLAAAVTAVAGRAEVPVADLATLQCGDVLLLDTPLREPLRLEVDGGPAGLRALLGRIGMDRAIQLIPSDAGGASTMFNDPSCRPAASPQDVELSPLDTAAAGGAALLPPRLAAFAGVKASVQVLAGRASTTVGELLALEDGAVLTLDRAVDAPFDIVLEGAVLARGQLVAVGEQLGVRVSEVCVPTARQEERR